MCLRELFNPIPENVECGITAFLPKQRNPRRGLIREATKKVQGNTGGAAEIHTLVKHLLAFTHSSNNED